MKSRVRQPQGTKYNREWLCKPEDGSSISNRNVIRLLEVLQISQATSSYGVRLVILWDASCRSLTKTLLQELASFSQGRIM